MSDTIFLAEIREIEFELFRKIAHGDRSFPLTFADWQIIRRTTADIASSAKKHIEIVPIEFAEFERFVSKFVHKKASIATLDQFAKARAVVSKFKAQPIPNVDANVLLFSKLTSI